jgi:hypothetical protein
MKHITREEGVIQGLLRATRTIAVVGASPPPARHSHEGVSYLHHAGFEGAKDSGTWNATNHVEKLTIPPDLEKAIRANPDASRNWVSYSASRRKGVLYRLAGAKRPETRARYLQDIIENMARNLSRAERMKRAGFRPKSKSSRPAKR